METRIVKFNLKEFIGDYIFLHELKDLEGEKDLIKKFDDNFYSSSHPVKVGIQTFLFNSGLAKDYPVLQGLATRCIAVFTK